MQHTCFKLSPKSLEGKQHQGKDAPGKSRTRRLRRDELQSQLPITLQASVRDLPSKLRTMHTVIMIVSVDEPPVPLFTAVVTDDSAFEIEVAVPTVTVLHPLESSE